MKPRFALDPVLWTLLLVALLAACQGSGPFGSTEPQPGPTVVRAALDEGQVLIDLFDERLAAAEARLVEITDERERAETAATLAEMRAVRDELQAAKDVADSALDEEGRLTPEGVAGAAAPFLPPPFNVILPLVVGVGAGWLRERNTRSSFTRLVSAINTAKRKHPKLATAMDEAGETIRLHLGSRASSLVDVVRKNGGRLPLLR